MGMKNYIRGFAVFLAAGLVLGYAGFPLQRLLGTWGLVASELLVLAVALAAMRVCRFPLRETFPTARVGVRQVGGFLLLYIAGQSIASFLTALTTLVSPQVAQRLEEVGQITQAPLYVAIPAVVILPAICEEALFRGVLRRCFAGLPDWLAAVTVGLLFGVFHLDPYRLVPTAVLGVAITYLCVKSGNFWLAVGYHLLNNLMSVLQSHFGSIGGAVTLGELGVGAGIGVCCWILASRILTKR